MGRKGSELSGDLKNVAVNMFQEGFSIAEIARRLQRPHSTVSYILKKFKSTGSVENMPRSGRPRVLAEQDVRTLERTVKVNRRDSLTDITNKFNQGRVRAVSRRTVQHHLHKHGFKRRVHRKKVVVSAVNRKRRLSWCREKRRWEVNGRWDKVIFSDESQVVVGSDNRVYVWRKRGEGYRPDLVSSVPSAKKKVFKVMIWGCICWSGVGTLAKVDGNINAEKYEEILEDNLWPVVASHFPDNSYLFQDDNAPVHRAGRIGIYKVQNNIKTISWPAQSPDLNIIENIWLYIKRKLSCRVTFINSNQDLYDEIFRIWTEIPPAYVQSLYMSIPRRIMQVIRFKGHLTKY